MDPLLEIVVDDMKHEGFGPTKFTTYRISSAIRGSSSEKPAFCRKRYSDFEKLRDEMLDACPGCVIPPLPVKQTLGKYAADPELNFSWYDAATLSQRVRKLREADAGQVDKPRNRIRRSAA